VLPPALRQMIAHEVELEGIRRTDAHRQHREGGPALMLVEPQRQATSQPEAVAVGMGATATAGPLQLTLAQRLREAGKLGGPKAGAAKVVAGTWLDRMRTSYTAQSAKGQQRAEAQRERGNKGQLPVLYKYHEGFTNAVKRPVLMDELF
jgi:chromosome transmission fidelity protein 18